MTYYWTTTFHLRDSSGSLLLQTCHDLGICKQVTTARPGYQVIQRIYYFAGESGEDDPTYTLKEILAEAEYRKALRERDQIEAEEGEDNA